jgi:carbonic anhydrase
MISGHEALRRLREGNERFASEAQTGEMFLKRMRSAKTDIVQEPVAIILGCSDARVPIEMVFDQELGDLFVIRVAGNIVAPSQVGSVEFAAQHFGTRLVLVMGHSSCGAIEAALEAATNKEGPASRNLLSIVDRVRASVESLLATDLVNDPVRLRREATRANVRASVNHLRHGSQIIEQLADEDGLVVVGTELDLSTGEVSFFDGLPE